MIREQEIKSFKDAGKDDMVRHKVKTYDETPGQTQNKMYDINTPGETSQEQSPDKFVDGESIEDLEDSPEQESYNVITRKSKAKPKTRNNMNVFERTD